MDGELSSFELGVEDPVRALHEPPRGGERMPAGQGGGPSDSRAAFTQ